jgi:hypothetical protein
MFTLHLSTVAIYTLIFAGQASADGLPSLYSCHVEAESYKFSKGEDFVFKLYGDYSCTQFSKPVQTMSSTQSKYEVAPKKYDYTTTRAWCFPVEKALNDNGHSFFFRAKGQNYMAQLYQNAGCGYTGKNIEYLGAFWSIISILYFRRIIYLRRVLTRTLAGFRSRIL